MAVILIRMPWTGEDTKDVLKKVIGGLIAAAILAIVYAIVEESEWYVALLLGAVLFILILVAIWRLGSSRPSATHAPPSETRPEVEERKTERPPEPAPEASSSSMGPMQSVGETRPSESSGDHPSSEAQQKAAKRAAKAEEKRLKKEAKSREKSAKP